MSPERFATLLALTAAFVTACSGPGALVGSGAASPGTSSPSPAASDPGPDRVPPPAAGTLVEVEGGSYTRLTPAEMRLTLQDPAVTVVNVHVPYEGRIDGTDLSIPFDRIGERATELPSTRDSTVVVYCRTGRMSAIAVRTLVRLGYSDIRELAGGFDAWISAGYPFETGPAG